MSRENRGDNSKVGLIGAILVGIVGVALYWSLFYSAGYQSGYNERKAKVEASHYASDTANQINRECSAKAGEAAHKCVTEIINAERESERGESDLAAQWKAADWVMWAGILAGAQLIATALGLYFVKLTLDATLEAVEETSKATTAMERQNELAEDTGKRQLRAYVAVSHYVIAADSNEPHKIRVVVHYQNVGETPAKEVATTLFVLSGPGAFDGANPRQEPRIDREGGRAIIGKGGIKQTAITVQADDTPENILRHGDYWVCFYGRINYLDVFGMGQETRYCAYVDASTRGLGMDHADAPNGNSMT